MNITSDCYFAIGKAHKVCEDYAWAGAVPSKHWSTGRPLILASDGCSSSDHTDFGARLLVANAVSKHAMRQGVYCPIKVIEGAEFSVDTLSLPIRCLDATLLRACPNNKGIVEVSVVGDGVVVARDRSGGYVYWLIEFSNNAPGYMSYWLDPQRMRDFFNPPPEWGLPQAPAVRTVIRRVVEADGTSDEVNASVAMPPLSPDDPNTFEHKINLDPEVYDLVVLLTDGVQSFQRKNGKGLLEPIPLLEVLNQIMAIKGLKGEFLTRRLQTFLGKFCPKNGWQHFDDVGAAAFALNLED